MALSLVKSVDNLNTEIKRFEATSSDWKQAVEKGTSLMVSASDTLTKVLSDQSKTQGDIGKTIEVIKKKTDDNSKKIEQQVKLDREAVKKLLEESNQNLKSVFGGISQSMEEEIKYYEEVASNEKETLNDRIEALKELERIYLEAKDINKKKEELKEAEEKKAKALEERIEILKTVDWTTESEKTLLEKYKKTLEESTDPKKIEEAKTEIANIKKKIKERIQVIAEQTDSIEEAQAIANKKNNANKSREEGHKKDLEDKKKKIEDTIKKYEDYADNEEYNLGYHKIGVLQKQKKYLNKLLDKAKEDESLKDEVKQLEKDIERINDSITKEQNSFNAQRRKSVIESGKYFTFEQKRVLAELEEKVKNAKTVEDIVKTQKELVEQQQKYVDDLKNLDDVEEKRLEFSISRAEQIKSNISDYIGSPLLEKETKDLKEIDEALSNTTDPQKIEELTKERNRILEEASETLSTFSDAELENLKQSKEHFDKLKEDDSLLDPETAKLIKELQKEMEDADPYDKKRISKQIDDIRTANAKKFDGKTPKQIRDIRRANEMGQESLAYDYLLKKESWNEEDGVVTLKDYMTDFEKHSLDKLEFQLSQAKTEDERKAIEEQYRTFLQNISNHVEGMTDDEKKERLRLQNRKKEFEKEMKDFRKELRQLFTNPFKGIKEKWKEDKQKLQVLKEETINGAKNLANIGMGFMNKFGISQKLFGKQFKLFEGVKKDKDLTDEQNKSIELEPAQLAKASFDEAKTQTGLLTSVKDSMLSLVGALTGENALDAEDKKQEVQEQTTEAMKGVQESVNNLSTQMKIEDSGDDAQTNAQTNELKDINKALKEGGTGSKKEESGGGGIFDKITGFGKNLIGKGIGGAIGGVATIAGLATAAAAGTAVGAHYAEESGTAGAVEANGAGGMWGIDPDMYKDEETTPSREELSNQLDAKADETREQQNAPVVIQQTDARTTNNTSSGDSGGSQTRDVNVFNTDASYMTFISGCLTPH